MVVSKKGAAFALKKSDAARGSKRAASKSIR
jgi:hypothetical protein